MRLAALASIFTAGLMWLALGGVPAQSQKTSEPTACESCCKGKSCPHRGAGHGGPGSYHGRPHPHEYKCVHQSERASKKAADAMSAQFNALGAEGWHLAKADNGFWCFRRPKPAK